MGDSTGVRRRLARRLGLASNGSTPIRCAYCPTALPWKEMTIDHLTPRGDGGSAGSLTNVVFCCASCNQARDQHHRGCSTCFSFPGSCMRAMIFRLAAYPPRCSYPCALSGERARAIRVSALRYFSLVNMVRSGRDYLIHDWRGDPWVIVPRPLARRWDKFMTREGSHPGKP